MELQALHSSPQFSRQSSGFAFDKRPRLGDDILIVDDDHAIAQFVAEVLHEEGYQVRVEHDGASALLQIMHRPPGLVFLDVAMPVMVGDDLLRYLRRHGFGDLPIVVMTAGLQPKTYLGAGATAVMPKPFTVDRLLSLAQRHLPRE